MISEFLTGGMFATALAIAVSLVFSAQLPPAALVVAGLLGGATQATSTPKSVYVRR
jgi:hypothetical protein